MKKFQLYGIGNGIVDILIKVNDQEFQDLGFEKASMTLVETAEQGQLIQRFSEHDQVLASGGSVANSVIAFAQMGGKPAFSTSLGDDR